jgi:phage I-like protein
VFDALSIPAVNDPAENRSRGLRLALANAQETASVAFGAGLVVALARADGDAVKPPVWVQVFPAGPEILARDGRRWTLSDPATIIAAFQANQADLPVDLEHASELKAPKGEPAPAQGWVQEMAVRDGVLCARVDWTAEGADQVVARRYRYVSPAFVHNEAREITAVRSLALVTQPALLMSALARDEGRQTPETEPSMTQTLLVRLAAALGLSATATEDQVVAAATSQVALASATRDPAQFVPSADLTAALARATTAEASLAARETADKLALATKGVDEATAAGKIAPESREHWLSIAQANPTAFTAAVAGLPSIAGTTTTVKDPKEKDKTGEDGLTPDQLAMCRQLGVTPVEFAKTLAEEGAA